MKSMNRRRRSRRELRVNRVKANSPTIPNQAMIPPPPRCSRVYRHFVPVCTVPVHDIQTTGHLVLDACRVNTMSQYALQGLRINPTIFNPPSVCVPPCQPVMFTPAPEPPCRQLFPVNAVAVSPVCHSNSCPTSVVSCPIATCTPHCPSA